MVCEADTCSIRFRVRSYSKQHTYNGFQTIKHRKIGRIKLRASAVTICLKYNTAIGDENYKKCQLNDKLIKHFSEKLCFWQPSYKSELLYSPENGSQVVEMGFEFSASSTFVSKVVVLYRR